MQKNQQLTNTYQETLKNYENFLQKRIEDIDIEQNTKRNLLREAKHYLLFLKTNNYKIDHKKTDIIRNYLKPYKITSRNTHISNINAFYCFIFNKKNKNQLPNWISDIPFVKQRTINKKIDKIKIGIDKLITSEEYNKMINTLCGNPRNQAILETLWTYGIREKELVDLKLKDIDIDEKPYPINITDSKSKARTAPTRHDIPYTKNWISQHPDYKNRKNSELPLFPSGYFNHKVQHLASRSIWHIVKKTSKNAGITRNITVHMFRHTSITNFFRERGDIQDAIEIFGAEPKTLQIYIHLSKEDICKKFKETMITKEPSLNELKKENTKINKLEQELSETKRHLYSLQKDFTSLLKDIKNKNLNDKLGIITLNDDDKQTKYTYDTPTDG